MIWASSTCPLFFSARQNKIQMHVGTQYDFSHFYVIAQDGGLASDRCAIFLGDTEDLCTKHTRFYVEW